MNPKPLSLLSIRELVGYQDRVELAYREAIKMGKVRAMSDLSRLSAQIQQEIMRKVPGLIEENDRLRGEMK